MIKGDYERLRGFIYFWGKSVTGFDDSKHCEACLLGQRDWKIRNDIALNIYHDIRFCGDYFYICGVSYEYKWSNNFHLVVKPGAGQVERSTYNGMKVVVTEAEEVKFDDKMAYTLYPDYGRKFLTCRNFQFGVQHYWKEQPKFLF
jgi:hypothetical protein